MSSRLTKRTLSCVSWNGRVMSMESSRRIRICSYSDVDRCVSCSLVYCARKLIAGHLQARSQRTMRFDQPG